MPICEPQPPLWQRPLPMLVALMETALAPAQQALVPAQQALFPAQLAPAVACSQLLTREPAQQLP